MAKNRIIGVNEAGRRIGEHHHRAVLTDHEIELIRRLREEMKDGHRVWSFGQLAKAFETTKGVIWDICTMRRRNQFVSYFKTVRVKPRKR